MAVIECPECSYLLSELDTQCPRCGRKIEVSAKGELESTPDTFVDREEETEDIEIDRPEEGEAKDLEDEIEDELEKELAESIAGSRREMITSRLALFGIVILVFAIICGFFVMHNQKKGMIGKNVREEHFRSLAYDRWRAENPTTSPDEFDKLLDQWAADPPAFSQWFDQDDEQ